MFRIVSGAQTGVDTAALEIGLELNIPIGGWYPYKELTMTYSGIPEKFKKYMKEMTPELFPKELTGLVIDLQELKTLKEIQKKSHQPIELTSEELIAYTFRTRQNVIDSDATLIIMKEESENYGGSKVTYDLAVEYNKPVLFVYLNDKDALERVTQWLSNLTSCLLQNKCTFTLNIGGPNHTKSIDIEKNTQSFLRKLLLQKELSYLLPIKLSQQNLFMNQLIKPEAILEKDQLSILTI